MIRQKETFLRALCTHIATHTHRWERQAVAARTRSAWARLIHKVYEVDPLECPKCGAPMQVIALIDDAEVIRRILEHLGCWAPREVQRNPRAPGNPPPVLELTYYPVPDIA